MTIDRADLDGERGRVRAAAWSSAALALIGYVVGSCSVPDSYPRASSGGGGASPDWSTTPGPHVSGGGSGGPCQAAKSDDGLWRIPSDGCYRHVDWPDAGCNVEVATNVQLAAPPLAWVTCAERFGGAELPGCEAQKVTWSPGSTAQLVSIVRWGEGYRIGFMLLFPGDNDQIAAVYDENGKAVAAWRAAYKGKCLLTRPLVTPSRVWLGVGNYHDGVKPGYTAPSWSDLAAASQPILYHSLDEYWTSRGDWAVAQLLDGATLEVVDLAANTDKMLAGDFARPQIVGDRVLALVYPEHEHGQLALASKTGEVSVLTKTASPDRVVNAASDGKTLAWIVQPGKDVGGWLWTSPFATTAAALVPTRRRPTPPIATQYSAAGDGFYAVYSYRVYKETGPGDDKIHVYRLTDAREWIIDMPPGGLTPDDMLYLDSQYLFYYSVAGIVRVRLSALGSGTPPP